MFIRKRINLKIVGIVLCSVLVIAVLLAPYITLASLDPVKFALIFDILQMLVDFNTYLFAHKLIVLAILIALVLGYYFYKKNLKK